MRPLALVLAVAWAVLSAPSAGAAPRPGFGWPLHGTVVVERGFDPPRSAYGPGHRGVDLRASVGQEVLAAGPGRVSYAGLLAGRGVVTVTHTGGLRTTYEPVVPSVRVGTTVARGAVLGTLSTGHASCRRGSCLHWGLLRGQVYLNPLSLVTAGDIRLLPVGAPAGRAITGSLRVHGMAPPAAGGEAQIGPGPGLRTGGALVVGAALLGLTAWRRQDARGRPWGARPGR